MMIKSDKVEYLQDDESRPFVRILDGQYTGVCFMLGAVRFDESEDTPVMSYQYEITDGRDTIGDIVEFETSLGDFIVEQIQNRLKVNDLVYSGGTKQT